MERRLERVQERTIAAIASRQHSVVARHQLVAVGVGEHEIDNRLKAGRLRAVYRGIYLVGPIAPPHAREMTAVLACGEGAVLSHRNAAALWQLLPYPASDHRVEVTFVLATSASARASASIALDASNATRPRSWTASP